jgi:hypothetical protein
LRGHTGLRLNETKLSDYHRERKSLSLNTQLLTLSFLIAPGSVALQCLARPSYLSQHLFASRESSGSFLVLSQLRPVTESA